MRSWLFHLGDVGFPSYFTLLTLGFGAGIYVGWREARKRGLDPDFFLDNCLLMVLAGLVGSRVLHVLVDGYFWDYYNYCFNPEALAATEVPGGCTSWAQCATGEVCNATTGLCNKARDCLLIFKAWRGGFTYYGGFILAVATAVWFSRRKGVPFYRLADASVPGIALGLVFGRIGCFLAGCCFGQTNNSPLAVAFPKGSPAWRMHKELELLPETATQALPVHATQLYSALSNMLIFLALLFIARRAKRDGVVFWAFAGLYAITRSAVEFVRADHRGVFLGELVSTSQIISLIIFIPCILYAIHLHRGREASQGENDRGTMAGGGHP